MNTSLALLQVGWESVPISVAEFLKAAWSSSPPANAEHKNCRNYGLSERWCNSDRCNSVIKDSTPYGLEKVSNCILLFKNFIKY